MCVFGSVDTTTEDFFMELVPQHNAQTLVPIITLQIAPWSTIWSNEWATYNSLASLIGYTYSTVSE